MTSTRTFTSLGVVASTATPVDNDSDPDRVQGVSYRKTDVTTFQEEEGELYNVPPSTEFINQKLFNQSSFTDVLNKNGVVGWSNQIDYTPPAIVWGSDNKFYTCKVPNGPSTKIVDPISDDQSNPIYWVILDNAGLLREQLAVQTPGDEGDRRVGYTDITVQTALDKAFNILSGLGNFKIVFSLNTYIVPYDPDRPYMLTTQAFNIANITPIAEDEVHGSEIHGLDVSFTTPLDDINYLSFITTSWTNGNKYIPGVTAYLYDKTINGFKCGYNFVDPRLMHRKGFNYKDYLYSGDPTDFWEPGRLETYFSCILGIVIT